MEVEEWRCPECEHSWDCHMEQIQTQDRSVKPGDQIPCWIYNCGCTNPIPERFRA